MALIAHSTDVLPDNFFVCESCRAVYWLRNVETVPSEDGLRLEAVGVSCLPCSSVTGVNSTAMKAARTRETRRRLSSR